MRSFEMRICDAKDLLEKKEKYEEKISNWEYKLRNSEGTYDYFLNLSIEIRVGKESLNKINARLDNMLKQEDRWLDTEEGKTTKEEYYKMRKKEELKESIKETEDNMKRITNERAENYQREKQGMPPKPKKDRSFNINNVQGRFQ